MARREDTVRQCALTREHRSKSDLIRFALAPDNRIVPDTDALAEGRGVWITLSATLVAEAARRKVFAKSLKQAVDVPDDLAELTRKRLEQRLLGALSMARKAGQLVTGATKVRAAIDKGECIALITASDASADGRAKMLGALKALERSTAEAGEVGRKVPHFELLESDQMGLALGLENVIHAALTSGAAAQSALARAEKLARYVGD